MVSALKVEPISNTPVVSRLMRVGSFATFGLFGSKSGAIDLAVSADPLLGMIEQSPLYVSAQSPYGYTATSGLSVKGRQLTLIQVSKTL